MAVLLLVMALSIVLAQGTNQQRHLAWIEDLGKARGVVDLSNERAVVAVSEPRPNEPLPSCKIRLLSVSQNGSHADAEIEVWSNVVAP